MSWVIILRSHQSHWILTNSYIELIITSLFLFTTVLNTRCNLKFQMKREGNEINETCQLGSTVVQWSELTPHSEKFTCSIKINVANQALNPDVSVIYQHSLMLKDQFCGQFGFLLIRAKMWSTWLRNYLRHADILILMQQSWKETPTPPTVAAINDPHFIKGW